jgi:hypothetical protein
MRSTIGSPRHAEPAPLSLDYPRCKSLSVSIRARFGPNDRRTRPAKTSPLYGPESDSPALPPLPSEIAAVGTGRFSATAGGACDSTGSRRPPDHNGRARCRDEEMPSPPARWVPAPDTSVRCRWSQGTGRSKRTLLPNLSCRVGDISRAEGCREDGTSRKATFPDIVMGKTAARFCHTE